MTWDKIPVPEHMREGDVILGLPSSGVHSNGFSLVRHVLPMTREYLTAPLQALDGKTPGEVLLAPTRIYVKQVLALMQEVEVMALSHITGGGFYENIPRSIPEGFCAVIDRSALPKLPVFDLIAREGNIPERDMFNTYNMGCGMSLVVKKEQADLAMDCLRRQGESPILLGHIEKGSDKIRIA